jgi:hypothetical protein
MRFYQNLPNTTVPQLLQHQYLHTTSCFTLTSTCSPWEKLRFEHVTADGIESTLELDVMYDHNLDQLGSTLLCNVVSTTERDALLEQVRSVVAWFRSSAGEVYWVKCHTGGLLDIKCESLLHGLAQELVEYATQPQPWTPVELENTREFVHSALVRANIYASDDNSPFVPWYTPDDPRTLTSGDPYLQLDSTRYDKGLVDTTRMRRDHRDRILTDARRSSFHLTCAYEASAGQGFGLISLWSTARIESKTWLRDHVQLDPRNPQFLYHIRRLNKDERIKFIVLDHTIDECATRTCGETPEPGIHTTQFSNIHSLLRNNGLNKPLLVCVQFPAVARWLQQAGASVSPDITTLNRHVIQITDLFVKHAIIVPPFEDAFRALALEETLE